MLVEGRKQVAQQSETHTSEGSLRDLGLLNLQMSTLEMLRKANVVLESSLTICVLFSPLSHVFAICLLSLSCSSSLKQFAKTVMFQLDSLVLVLFVCTPQRPHFSETLFISLPYIISFKGNKSDSQEINSPNSFTTELTFLF